MFDAVLSSLDAAAIGEALRDLIPPSADLCCDGGKEIVAYAKAAKLKVHVPLAHTKRMPDEPQFHIENVRAYQARLKEWMRRFHGVSTENLSLYLSWFRTLETASGYKSPAELIATVADLNPEEEEETQ